MDVAIHLAPGDIIMGNGNIFRVAGYPELVVYKKKQTVRVAVMDVFGRTQVLVREDIQKRLRKAAKEKMH
jgi:hypothetical protein